MSIHGPIVAAAALSVALLFTTAASAFDNADDCILEKTFECLDADDFWDCYDFIVAGCNDQIYPLVLPPGSIKRLKAATAVEPLSLVDQDHDQDSASFRR